MRDGLEIMLKSYDSLRQEIQNSISWQNRVLTAAAAIIPIILGLGLTKTQEALGLLLIVIPPAVIALISLWLIEQSRMMRAGDYLQFLEDEINIKAKEACILWENWLRTGIPGRIHKIHYWAQYLGVISIFYLVSGISLWNLWRDLAHYNFPMWAWWLCVAFLIFLLVLVILAVRHRPAGRDKFEEWKKKYWNKLDKEPAQ